nr:PAS domain S-box protein [Rhabdochromatium marinum]
MLDIAPATGWFSVPRLILEATAILILSILLGWIVRRHLEQQRQIEDNAGLFQAVMEVSPIPFVILEQDSIRALNPAFVSLFGYTLNDIPTLDAWWPRAYPDSVYREQVAREWQSRIEQAHRAGTPFEPMEVRVHSKDGTVRTILASAQPLGAAFAGRVLVSLADITQVRAVAERLRILLDSASDGVHILDEDGNILDCSQSFARMLGYSLDEARRLNVTDWEAQTPRDQLLPELRRLIREPATFETLYRRKDGSTFFVEINVADVVLDSRRYLYASSRDISERHFYEAALKDRETRFRLLFENMNLGAAVYEVVDDGDDFVFLDVNQAVERYEKRQRTDLIGRRVTDVFPAVRDLGLLDVFKRVWCTGISEHCPLGFYRDNRVSGWRENFVYRLSHHEIVALYEDITPRKQAEKALRDSEARFRGIFERANMGIAFSDPAGNLIVYNASFKTLLGYSADELKGVNFVDFTYPEDLEQEQVFVKEILAGTRNDYRMEKRYRVRDGGAVWVDLVVTAIRDDQGEVVNFIGIVVDITERKAAEKSLRESEEKFHTAMFHAPIGKALVAPDGHFLEVNPALCQLVGYTRDEFLTCDFQSITHPDDLDTDLDYLHQLLAGKIETYQMEKRYFHRDGHLVWVQLNVALVRDESKAPRYFISQIQDITERKLTTANLEASERRYRALIDASAQIVWSCNPAGVITEDSPSWRAYTGQSFAQWSGHGYAEAIHPDDRPAVMAQWHDALAKGEVNTNEYRLRHVSGEWRWNLARSVPIKDDTGRVLSWVGMNSDIHDRRMMEEELRESQERYDLAVRGSNDGIWDWNIHTNALYLAPRFKEIMGYQDDAFASTLEGFWSQIHPEDKDPAWASVEAHLRNAAPYEDEYRLRHQSGDYLWIKARGAAIFDLHGQPLRMAGSIRDITEQKEADLRLQEALSFNESVLFQSPLAIAVYRAAGPCVVANQALASLVGATRKQLLAQDFHQIDMFHETGLHDDLLGALADGRLREREVHTKSSFGKDLWVTCQILPTVLNHEPHLVMQFSDLTELHARNLALRSAMNRLELAAEVAAIGIWVWDLVDHSLTWDQRLFEIYQVPEDTRARGIDYDFWRSRCHPEDLARTEAALAAAVRGERLFDNAFRILLPDGSMRHVQAAAIIEEDESGEPRRLVGITRDLTDEKAAETALLVAKQQAETAAWEAAAANRAKSEFLANMSHEIRTPMNAVMGLAQLLLDTELTTRQRDYLTKLYNAARSLLGILNDILDYSKIEAGKLDLETVDVEMAELLENSANLFSLSAEDKGLELIFEVDPDIPPILVGDPLRLRQIINNLLGNAIKFTHKGHILLSISLLEQNSDEVTLKISVRDTGIGMTPEQLGRLFSAFEQADTSTTRRFGGSGLGLAISKHLVDMMGGELSVESKPDQGSTFAFSVSLQRSPTTKQHTAAHLPAMRTLIVDDQAIARDVLKNLVDIWSFEAEVADSGEEGLAKASEALRNGRPYDLILIDWKLPGIDGIELARYLREEERRFSGDACQSIVIMVTAHGRLAAQQATQQIKLDAILDKPVMPSQLFDVVVGLRNGGFDAKSVQQLSALQHVRGRLQMIQGARILLVEDNPTNQLVARELLENMGLAVALANQGREAVTQAIAQRFDAILMDLQMPEMDGLEATRRIRALPQGLEVPIIAMTAAAMTADREACRSVGMNDFLSKPIDIAELTTVLLRWISPQAVEAEEASVIRMTRSDGLDTPFTIPGLDLDQALRYMGQNWGLLQRALDSFARDFAESALDLDDHLAQGRWTEAHRLVHTLKGVAKTIGATALHEASQRLESSLAAKKRDSTTPFKTALADTLTALTTLSPVACATPVSRAAPVSYDDERIATLLRELQVYLKRSEFVRPEWLDEIEQELVAPQAQAAFRTLKTAIEAFDYSAAKTALTTLASLLDIALDA